MKKFIVSMISLGALAAGCTTADFGRDQINIIPKQRLEQVLNEKPMPARIKGRDRVLRYSEAVAVASTFGNLPNQSVQLYFVSAGGNPRDQSAAEARRLDTTGPLNAYADELLDLQNSLPSLSERRRMIIGNPDSTEMVASRGAANQASNTCGLLGVDVYSKSGKRNFTVGIKEVTGLKGVREQSVYETVIRFGQPEIKTNKERADFILGLEALEDGGMAFWAGGQYAALGAVVERGVDALWSLAEGRRVPRGSFIQDRRENLGALEGAAADTYNILATAKDLGADGIAVVPYNTNGEQGVGVLYLKRINSFSPINGGPINGGIAVRTNRLGANHLCSFAHRALGMATRVGYDGRVVHECNEGKDKPYIIPGGGITGGESGAPGGNGGGPSGGGSGGPGGG